MIISASRRTDIPAFYAGEFMAAIRAGFIDVPHPRDPRNTSRVSLQAKDVDAIVFWTRDARPLLPHLRELDAHGYFYYFQYTLLDGPFFFDPDGPRGEEAIAALRELAGLIGPERVVWRYDPIVLAGPTSTAYHREKFKRLSASLSGATRRVMISFVDFYRSILPRLRRLENKGIIVRQPSPEDLAELMPSLVETAAAHGQEIFSCAEKIGLQSWGVQTGKCIDAVLLTNICGRPIRARKDPRQRKACGCVESRDVGVYGTCRRNCVYCYAK